jgi:hypothetical protein
MLTEKSPRKTNRHRVASALTLMGVLWVLAGCASKEFSYVTTVAGGEQLKFTFANGGPVHAKAEGFEILDAAIQPEYDAKKVFYGFRFSDAANGKSLQSLKVEDVSEAVPVLLLEETQPKVVNRIWAARSGLFAADDPSLKWVTYVSDSVRVYRFTLTLTDGRKLVLHQPSMVPGWIKMSIRGMFGEKY